MKDRDYEKPIDGILPEVIDWYREYGEHKYYMEGVSGVGGEHFARTDMLNLQKLARPRGELKPNNVGVFIEVRGPHDSFEFSTELPIKDVKKRDGAYEHMLFVQLPEHMRSAINKITGGK